MWATSYALALLTAVPFACYSLAVGLWVPAQAAVDIAGASISIFAFLGNLFMPLSGSLFDFAHFTPMYGVGNLALRALQGDVVTTEKGIRTLRTQSVQQFSKPPRSTTLCPRSQLSSAHEALMGLF